MFRQLNGKNKRNVQNINNGIPDEQKAEDSLINTGNENTSRFGNLLINPSNETNNSNIAPNNKGTEKSRFREFLEKNHFSHPAENEAISALNQIRKVNDTQPKEIKKKKVSMDADQSRLKPRRKAKKGFFFKKTKLDVIRETDNEEDPDEDLKQIEKSPEPVGNLDFAAEKLPAQEEKAEDQNKPVPPEAAPQKFSEYEYMRAYQECFGENFDEKELFKNDNPNEIDTRSAETRKKQIAEAYIAKMRKEWAQKEQSEKAKLPNAEPKAGEPVKKEGINNDPVPEAAAPQKEKQLFYRDPENVSQDEAFETEPGEDLDAVLDPNESQEVSYLERRADGLDDDLIVHSDTMEKGPKEYPDRNQTKAEKDMYPVKNWNFTAQKMKDAGDISGWSKFKNKLTHIFSGIFGFLSSAFGIKQSIAAITRYAAKKKKKAIQSEIQDKKDHSLIPGWEGAKYDPAAKSGEDILADFRRVPTVWSQLTAEKASEGEGDNEKPLPPVISIFVDQPKDNSNQSMAGSEMGHTMIGIEYSRFSRYSNRYERYKLQYGFYPVGSNSIFNTFAMAHHDAIGPGQLRDDSGHSYTVSRRYPATAKQVNTILEASETYADKGYGFYARNCTTFVRDMAKLAHLPVSDNLFELEEVGFSDLANLGRIGADITGENNLAGMENELVSRSQKKDESYSNYGNKRITQEDFDNYKKSVRGKPSEYKDTYIPGSVGEKLRRETTGEIGSQHFRGEIKIDQNVDPAVIRDEINRQGQNLKDIIENQMLPEARRYNNDIPEELLNLIDMLPFISGPLDPIIKSHENNKVPQARRIQTARQSLSMDISRLNRIYYQYFKGDKRLHKPLMQLISVMNIGISFLDKDYQEAFENNNYDDDLGHLPKMMYRDNTIVLGRKSIKMSPTAYEAYLQIYKNPDDAFRACARYAELSDKNKAGYHWYLHPWEKKEWEKSKRIHDYVMDYVQSHRYMMEKDAYSQQDVDYVFQLLDREDQGSVTGDLVENSAGNIYLAMIFEKIFSGIVQRVKAYTSQNEQNMQQENLIRWLDDDMSNSLMKNQNQMLTILRGLKKSQMKKNEQLNLDSMFHELQNKLYIGWCCRVFDGQKQNIDPDLQGKMKNICGNILSDNAISKNFQNLLKKLIKQVLIEDKALGDAPVKDRDKSKSGDLPKKG